MDNVLLDKLNESYGYIHSESRDIKMDLYNHFTYFVDGYQFMKSYKFGYFDGKVHLINGRDFTFPLGLTPEIYLYCHSKRIPVSVTDSLKNSFVEEMDVMNIDDFFSERRFFSKGQEIIPREDQFEAVKRAIKSKRCINICPTSFGKSLCITMECLWYIQRGMRCLIVVPTKDLVNQFQNDIYDYATNEEGNKEDWYPEVQKIYSGEDKFLHDDTTICVSTWQSLIKFADEDFMDQFGLVVLDECFDGDSLVLTPQGYKKIKDIKIGERIINYSEKSNTYKEDTVIEVYKNLTTSKSEKMYELEFDKGKKIRVTGNHKFLTDKGWKRADELQNEDILKMYQGRMNLIRKREIEKPDTVYNLHVENDHNYIVENVVVSNCHKGSGNSISKIMYLAKNTPYRTGWTGTLSNEILPTMLVKGHFGPEKQIITTRDLMDKDIVAKLNIEIARFNYPEAKSKVVCNMDYINQVREIETYYPRTKCILSIIPSFCQGTGLMFYKHIKHGESLETAIKHTFPERNVYLVHGGYFTKNGEKYKTFEDLKPEIEKDESGIVIANYQLASTGISIKNLHWLMFASPLKSYISVLQSIGRGLRVSETKRSVKLMDIVDNFSYKKRKAYAKNYALKHFEERFRIYNESQFQYEIKSYDVTDEMEMFD